MPGGWHRRADGTLGTCPRGAAVAGRGEAAVADLDPVRRSRRPPRASPVDGAGVASPRGAPGVRSHRRISYKGRTACAQGWDVAAPGCPRRRVAPSNQRCPARGRAPCAPCNVSAGGTGARCVPGARPARTGDRAAPRRRRIAGPGPGRPRPFPQGRRRRRPAGVPLLCHPRRRHEAVADGLRWQRRRQRGPRRRRHGGAPRPAAPGPQRRGGGGPAGRRPGRARPGAGRPGGDGGDHRPILAARSAAGGPGAIAHPAQAVLGFDAES
jgi:hypothetical protein